MAKNRYKLENGVLGGEIAIDTKTGKRYLIDFPKKKWILIE